jgi:hypothetical protein
VRGSIDEVWEDVASDPDPNTDLDYELQSLTVIKVGKERGGSYMILPGEADRLESEEFMVADPGSVCQLNECR